MIYWKTEFWEMYKWTFYATACWLSALSAIPIIVEIIRYVCSRCWRDVEEPPITSTQVQYFCRCNWGLFNVASTFQTNISYDLSIGKTLSVLCHWYLASRVTCWMNLSMTSFTNQPRHLWTAHANSRADDFNVKKACLVATRYNFYFWFER